MSELKPCKDCAGEGLLYVEHVDSNGKLKMLYSVVCIKCGNATAGYEKEHTAVEAWN